jgi:hypothetical protein
MDFAGTDIVIEVEMNPLASSLAELSGLVINADTGNPILDGQVLVEVIGVGSTNTDETGHYLITGIPPGTYPVRISHPQYETAEY